MRIFSKVLFSLVVSNPCFYVADILAQQVEEIIITAVRDTSVVKTENTLVAAPDTAQLLKQMPGANINKNGELTGIAQYRGMYGERLNISINGGHISSGGPNAMDAPLHYAPVAILESLTIQRGVVPVSAGQETLGGHVEAITFSGEFTNSNRFQLNSRIYAGGQSVNEGNVISGLLFAANDRHLVRLGVLREAADDSQFGRGKITPSEFKRQRFDFGYGFRNVNQELKLSLVRNETGDSGTAALPMDIKSIDSDLMNINYVWQGNTFSLKAEASINEIAHWMTNFHLRRPPSSTAMMSSAMLYRQVFAESDNSGFKLAVEQEVDNGLWRYGLDGHFAEHSAGISNPNAKPFFIRNFNSAQRDIVGVFIEREMSVFNSSTLDRFGLGSTGLKSAGLEVGIRFNQVKSDSGVVSANLNPMNMTMGMPVIMNAMAAVLADRFNSQGHNKVDHNTDWFARLSVATSRDLTWYLGLARKTRSPSYQERYLWVPLESTGGLADGKKYVGNIDLNPEVSHEIELGFDWQGNGFSFYPRLFYKQVNDYIQGTPGMDMQVNMLAQMMKNMGMGTAEPLQFNNVDARFSGVDLESSFRLTQNINLRLLFSHVKGTRDDINDNLYRITPSNLLLAVDYERTAWSVSIEAVGYQKQDRVSSTNLEEETPGYALANITYKHRVTAGLEIGVGINNIFDREYKDHLAGYNRAYNPGIELRERLTGLGRSLFGRLIWEF